MHFIKYPRFKIQPADPGLNAIKRRSGKFVIIRLKPGLGDRKLGAGIGVVARHGGEAREVNAVLQRLLLVPRLDRHRLKQGVKFSERLAGCFDLAIPFEVVTFHHVRHGEVVAPIGIGRIERGKRAIALARNQFGVPRALL